MPPTLINNNAQPNSVNSAGRKITLYWKPTSLTLNARKRNYKLAKLWFSHNVSIFFESTCKAKGVKFKLQSHGQKGRLYWNEYKLYATLSGPLSCTISGLDEYFDSVDATLYVRVRK
jgi:hypothetical protein